MGKEFRDGIFAGLLRLTRRSSEIFRQKSVKFAGSRMLCYGVISDWKMKFLQASIEKISVISKDLNYRWWFFEKFFTYPVSTCKALALTSKPKNLKIFLILFILMNFEILTSDLENRPKSRVLTFQGLRGPGCSVTEI